MSANITDHMLAGVHIMVDIETVGLKPGCPVLQIAATCSVMDEEDSLSIVKTFNEHISYKDCLVHGLVPESKTFEWWSEQDADLQARVFSGTESLDNAIIKLYAWIADQRNKYNASKFYFWSKPARFDFPILEAAIDVCNFNVYPWTHREVMDARTIFALYANSHPEPVFRGVKHDALADAEHQARYLNQLLEEFSRG